MLVAMIYCKAKAQREQKIVAKLVAIPPIDAIVIPACRESVDSEMVDCQSPEYSSVGDDLKPERVGNGHRNSLAQQKE